jgi:hypothetical protein
MDADTNGDGLPDGWFTWKPKGSEINSEVTQDGTLRIINSGKTRGGVATRKFSLEAETKYVLEIKLRGQITENKVFGVSVLSDKGQQIQWSVPKINIENNEVLLRYEFETTEDIKEGKQYIIFDLAGSENGYVEILDVALYSIH